MRFVMAVRDNKVSAPTSTKFRDVGWSKAFEEHHDGSDEDARLFDTGLWFAGRLESARATWRSLPRLNLPSEHLVRLVAAKLNAHVGLQSESPLRVLKSSKQNSEDAAAVADQGEGGAPSALVIDRAYLGQYTAFVSAVRIVIANAAAGRETEGPVVTDGDSAALFAALQYRFELAVHYEALEHLWSECLWNDWRVTREGEADVVRPSKVSHEAWRAVGMARRDDLGLQMANLAARVWRQFSSDERLRKAAAKVVIGVERRGDYVRPVMGTRAVAEEDPPVEWLLQPGPHEIFFRGLSDAPMHRRGGVTIRQMTRSFWAISPLAQLLLEELPLPEVIRDRSELSEFAPLMRADDLKLVFTQAAGISTEQAAHVLDAFALRGNAREDPWSKPLIRVSEDVYTLNAAVLSSPNFLWALERWMSEGGLDPQARGPEFEQVVRSQLAEANVLPNAVVWPKALTLRGSAAEGRSSTEEIDLVLRMGQTIVVGELKCTFMPTEPFDYYSYLDLLERARRQVERKWKFVHNNVKALIEATGWERLDADSVTILPAVVTSQPLGVGAPIEGTAQVPVTDLLLLRRYLASLPLEQHVIADINGVRHVGRRSSLYDSADEAEARLSSYLHEPPQLAPFFENLTAEYHSLLHFEGERPAQFVSIGVRY